MSAYRYLTLFVLLISLVHCTSKQDAEKAAKNSPSPVEAAEEQPEVHGSPVGTVTLTNPLNKAWVAQGQAIYDTKCLACHKLDATRVVGPGWKDVTKRRKPEWVMNMITNVEMMLETDAEAQKLLEQCLVRMPNQNITQEEARSIYEFMRSNDGEK